MRSFIVLPLMAVVLCCTVCDFTTTHGFEFVPHNKSRSITPTSINTSCIKDSPGYLRINTTRQLTWWCGGPDCLAYNITDVIGMLRNLSDVMSVRARGAQNELSNCIADDFFTSPLPTYFVGDRQQSTPLLKKALVSGSQNVSQGGIWTQMIRLSNGYKDVSSLCCLMNGDDSLVPAWNKLNSMISVASREAWTAFLQPSVNALQNNAEFASSHPIVSQHPEWNDMYEW